MNNITSPISVYNADKSQLIAIFKNVTFAVKFIYGTSTVSRRSLGVYIKGNLRILPKTSQHKFKIAVRYSSFKQIEELGGLPFLIKDESLLKFSPKPGNLQQQSIM